MLKRIDSDGEYKLKLKLKRERRNRSAKLRAQRKRKIFVVIDEVRFARALVHSMRRRGPAGELPLSTLEREAQSIIDDFTAAFDR